MKVLRPLAAILIGVALVEGASSLLLLAISLPGAAREPFSERLHTHYDPELGWVNVPDTSRPDLYGPGVGLTVNAQGFRGRSDVAAGTRPGITRVVCSGDSFTLGYGVADDETWCARLAEQVPDLESINMGQGGYGIDQAFLWYQRDAAPLEHQILLFAFIHEDFGRMLVDSFFGYGKPRLRLEAGQLQLDNVPVPRAAYWAPWLTQNLDLFSRSRFVELLKGILGSSGSPETVATDLESLSQLSWAVFDALTAASTKKGSRLVLVYLPMREDHGGEAQLDWRTRLAGEARARDLLFLDLIPDLRRLPASELDRLFIPAGALAYPAAAGHYSAAGNEWVAERLIERLLAAKALPLQR